MLLGLFAGALLLLLAKPVARRVEVVMALVQQRRAVLQRERSNPQIQDSTGQNVNWWDFLNAGWMSIVCHESHRDEQLALSGAALASSTTRLLCNSRIQISSLRFVARIATFPTAYCSHGCLLPPH